MTKKIVSIKTLLAVLLYSLVLSAEEAQLTPLLRLGAGACAGIIAMSATYPMDMVRGRITVQVFFFSFFFYRMLAFIVS